MTSNVDVATVVELLLATGVLTFFVEIGKRLTNRNRAKIDAAAVVQEAALDLIEPIRKELRQARREASELRSEMTDLRDAFDKIYAWARMARRELDARGAVGVPPLPVVQIPRTNGSR